ncbi:MAG: esterase, partial [Actinomycetota bacterium]
MRRDHLSLYSPAIGADGGLIAYGSYGRPLLVFPSEQGKCFDYENNGMIGAISHLIDEGRV